jgi:hypothetical protein
MNPLVRDQLCRIVAQFGPEIHQDPRRCEALLKDLCPQDKREVHVLAAAAREKVPAELAGPAVRAGALAVIGRLSKRLEDNLALAPEAARWGVESWALALGALSANQLAAVQVMRKNSPPAPPTVQPPPVVARRAVVARPARPGAGPSPVKPPPVIVSPVIKRRPRLISQIVVAAVLLILVAGVGMTVLGEAGFVDSFRGPIEDIEAPFDAPPATKAAASAPAGEKIQSGDSTEVTAPVVLPQSAAAPPPSAISETSSPFTAEELAMVLEEAERIETLRKSKRKE